MHGPLGSALLRGAAKIHQRLAAPRGCTTPRLSLLHGPRGSAPAGTAPKYHGLLSDASSRTFAKEATGAVPSGCAAEAGLAYVAIPHVRLFCGRQPGGGRVHVQFTESQAQNVEQFPATCRGACYSGARLDNYHCRYFPTHQLAVAATRARRRIELHRGELARSIRRAPRASEVRSVRTAVCWHSYE